MGPKEKYEKGGENSVITFSRDRTALNSKNRKQGKGTVAGKTAALPKNKVRRRWGIERLGTLLD